MRSRFFISEQPMEIRICLDFKSVFATSVLSAILLCLAGCKKTDVVDPGSVQKVEPVEIKSKEDQTVYDLILSAPIMNRFFMLTIIRPNMFSLETGPSTKTRFRA